MMTTFLPGPFDSNKVGFSAGVDVGDLIYADASALDRTTLQRLPEVESIADETRICFERLNQTLAQAGCSLADLVKVNCYLTDDSFRSEFERVFADTLGPGPYPLLVVQVAGLAGQARVLLDTVAAR